MICYVVKKKDSIAPEEPLYYNKNDFWMESLCEATFFKTLSDAERFTDLDDEESIKGGVAIAKVEINEVNKKIKMIENIQEILNKYSADDYPLFYNTVDMLCSKGVANGTYKDYSVLTDVIGILGVCENMIKANGGSYEQKENSERT